jgi:hypothetical protein
MYVHTETGQTGFPLTRILLYPKSDTDGYFSDYASLASSTTSIGSSVFDYQYENGRRYHAYRAGQYVSPLITVHFLCPL